MGRFYSVPFTDLATGTVANTFFTAASVVVAATLGHRARLRSLSVGPSDDAPADQNLALKISRIADLSAGTAGTTTAQTPNPALSSSPAAQAGGNVNYTAEPTAYESVPLWAIDINTRGSVIMQWSADDAPIAAQDQVLALLAAPRSTTAIRFSGCLVFEEF